MLNGNSNILIVGGGAVASSLARKLSQYSDVDNIYVASSKLVESDFYTSVDIGENDLTELLKFVCEKDICLTIPVSSVSLKSDIVAFFQANGQMVFAPPKNACAIFYNDIASKKFIYKMKAQTSKFGVYNKPQLAYDYMQNVTFPLLISGAETSGLIGDDKLIASTFGQAARFVDELFINKSEQEVLIENFVYGKRFTVYFITDGYSVLPITSVSNDLFFDDTKGLYAGVVSSQVPNTNISEVVLNRLEGIVKNIISYFEGAYVGIIGLEGVLYDIDRFYIDSLIPFFKDSDSRAILNLLEEDVFMLFNSCVNGSFSDMYHMIKTNNYYSASVIVYSEKDSSIITGLNSVEDIDNIDFINVNREDNIYKTVKGKNFVITRTSATLSRAKMYLQEDLDEISAEGIFYRKMA